MEQPLALLFCTITAYGLGSIMGAFWICKFSHLPDPSHTGSNNPGATNVYRLGGWLPATLTLTWDAAKGAISIGLSLWFNLTPYEQGVVAVAVILGHMLPMFHKFKGGKGVATVLGCGLVLAWQTTLVLAVLWGSIIAWKKVSSIASLTAALVAPWVAWTLNPDYSALYMALSLFILIRHRENIINLAKGNERSL